MDGWKGSEELEAAIFWESMVEANAVVYEGEQRVVRVGRPALQPQPRALEGQRLLVPDEERTNLNASRFWL
jgi:hypothetical protein